MSVLALQPQTDSRAGRRREVKRCALSALWFVAHYVQIEDVQEARGWIPFDLWPEQGKVLRALLDNQYVVVLKARQLGMTWLTLAFALWLMLFRAQATILLFSRRDDEARELLRRLKGMYARLPGWLQDLARRRGGPRVVTDNEHVWELGNGSTARAFPPTAGDSYTATFALVDEADLIPEFQALMGSVKPTVDAGGKLALISRADKRRPNSPFKQIYRAARAGLNDWHAIFLPWYARPGRTAAWYEAQKQESITNTGGLDYLWEQYPETDEQALATRQVDKRIPAAWLFQRYVPRRPIALERLPGDCPLIPGLEVYVLPARDAQYVIGADTAEGNPSSDDSAITVLDAETGEEAAALAAKVEPAVLGAYIDQLSAYYNHAPALVERNNHGHAVLLWLKQNSRALRLRGEDRRDGWLTNERGKALMYDDLVRELRDHGVTIHSEGTFTQLGSIEASTLRAPEGDPDDRAVSFALAVQARGAAVKQKAKPGRGPEGLAGYRG